MDLVDTIAPSPFQSLPNIVPEILDFVIELYPEVDVLKNWTIENCDKDSDSLSFLQSILDFTAIKSGKKVTQYLFQDSKVNSLIKDNDWRKRVLGLELIFYSGEGCFAWFEPILGEILNSICSLVNDTHPKVRWCICNSIAQLTTDFGPDIHNNYHHLLFPTVFNLVNDPEEFVRLHAVRAQFNLFSDCPPEIITLYSGRFIDSMITQLQDISTENGDHIQTLASYAEATSVFEVSILEIYKD